MNGTFEDPILHEPEKEQAPKGWKGICNSAEAKQWIAGAQREFESLLKNKTYVLVPPDEAKDQQLLNCEWICRKTIDQNGKIIYKVRLVIKGYMQVHGIDYLETFAPVIRFETLRALLILATMLRYKVLQHDFDTAFLNATLPGQYRIFMRQTHGFVHPTNPDYICFLKKSLYGLKQAPREWNNMLYEFLKRMNFRRAMKDYGLYWKRVHNQIIFVAIYVDDMLVIGPDHLSQEFVAQVKREFKIKELGPVSKILGIKVNYSLDRVEFDQSNYIQSILKKFRMDDCKPSETPMELKLKLGPAAKDDPLANSSSIPFRSVVGSIQYLVTGSRPELSYSTNFFSQFLCGYTQQHWNYLKRVLRYLRGTSTHKLCMNGVEARRILAEKRKLQITVYADADFHNEEDGKSITGFVTYLNGQFISGKSWKQSIVTESTSEAELVAANEGAKDGLWLKYLLEEMDLEVSPILLFMDNKSALQIAQHPTHHKRAKHLELRLLKLRQFIEDGLVEVQYVESAKNVADVFTKSLAKEKLKDFRNQLGIEDSHCRLQVAGE